MTTRRFTRRELLKLTAAGAAVGTLGALRDGRRLEGQGGRGGRRLGGADDGQVPPSVVRGHDRRDAGGAEQDLRLLPDLQPGDRGSRKIDELTMSYDGLRRHGVNVVHDTVTAVDADRKEVRLASGGSLPFDRAVVSPGIEFMYEQVQGMNAAATETIPHAWKAGPQTLLLRAQLEAMADGGVVVMSVPAGAVPLPAGPYERACQIGTT